MHACLESIRPDGTNKTFIEYNGNNCCLIQLVQQTQAFSMIFLKLLVKFVQTRIKVTCRKIFACGI